MNDTRKLVTLSLLIAMGAALHAVEGMLSLPMPLPGVKLGVANIVTLLALCRFGFRAGMTVALARVLLGSLVGGLFLAPGFLLSLSGGCAGALVMAILLRGTRCFSVIGISVAGAVGHNLGQLAAAGLILHSSAVMSYLPVLLLAAVPTGLFTGSVLAALLVRLERAGIGSAGVTARRAVQASRSPA
jgi:heptaprenyl diphosphate synthase